MDFNKLTYELLQKIKSREILNCTTIDVANDLAEERKDVDAMNVLDEFEKIERNGYAKFEVLVGLGDQVIRGLTEKGNNFLK